MAPSKTIIAGMAAASLAIALAGCALSAKTADKTPPAPKPSANTTPTTPVALSIPQTQVELPRPQPVDPAALAVETPPPTPVQVETPTPAHPAAPPARQQQRPRTEPVAPPAAQPPAEPERPSVTVIMSAAEIKRLQESAQTRKREVVRILDQLKSRRLSQAQKNIVTSIRSLVALSDEAEKKNDMSQADVLAERAQILGRDLLNGR